MKPVMTTSKLVLATAAMLALLAGCQRDQTATGTTEPGTAATPQTEPAERSAGVGQQPGQMGQPGQPADSAAMPGESTAGGSAGATGATGTGTGTADMPPAGATPTDPQQEQGTGTTGGGMTR